MKIVSLILICVYLTACATQRKIVYVPTPVKCPQPVIYPEPDYPVRHLIQADKANPSAVVKSFAISLRQCIVHNKLLRAQLEGYRYD